MSELKITPGPWKAFKRFRWNWGVLVDGEDPDDDYLDIEIDGERAEANAQAISAVPEMIEALEWLTHVCWGVGKAGGKPEPGEYEESVEAAKAALAKAKGEAK